MDSIGNPNAMSNANDSTDSLTLGFKVKASSVLMYYGFTRLDSMGAQESETDRKKLAGPYLMRHDRS